VLKEGGYLERPPDTMTFENDEAAINHATKLLDGRAPEVWDGLAWSAN
jgi:hypothetical protein